MYALRGRFSLLFSIAAMYSGHCQVCALTLLAPAPPPPILFILLKFMYPLSWINSATCFSPLVSTPHCRTLLTSRKKAQPCSCKWPNFPARPSVFWCESFQNSLATAKRGKLISILHNRDQTSSRPHPYPPPTPCNPTTSQAQWRDGKYSHRVNIRPPHPHLSLYEDKFDMNFTKSLSSHCLCIISLLCLLFIENHFWV